MHDELLSPTIRSPATAGGRPWRPLSVGYVAFFGGVVAGTTISYLDARRLGADARDRRLVAVVGMVGLAVAVVATVALYSPDGSTSQRTVSRVVAVLAFLLQARLLRRHARSFEVRDGDYGPLWLPGLAAVVGCGLIEALVLAVAVLVLT